MSETTSLSVVLERRYPVTPVPVTDPDWRAPEERRCPILETRAPVTPEHVALFVSLGKEPSNELEAGFLQDLHLCISAMVYGMSHQFARSCRRDEVDDLAQSCWLRILRKIHLFKFGKSKLTTWSHHVCFSVLCRAYRKSKKYNTRYVQLDEDVSDTRLAVEDSRESALGSDMRKAVRDLIALYPDREAIIIQMLGTPDADIVPSTINYAKTALECGIGKDEVKKFHLGCILPFFAERFKDQQQQEERA